MNNLKDNNQGQNRNGLGNPSKGQGQNMSQRRSFGDNNGHTNGQSNLKAMTINKEEGPKNAGGLLFILKKSEKLTTALYMVTDIMPEREPMKWKMRESSVELLSDTTVALDATMGERIAVLGTAIRKIEKVVSFLDIAQASRMVSEMNSSVLKKEYLSLKSVIEGEWEKLFDRSKNIFTDSFFDVPVDYQSTFPQIENTFGELPKETPVTTDKRQLYVEKSEQHTDIKNDNSSTPASVVGANIRPNVRLGGNTPHAEKHPLPVKVHADPMAPVHTTPKLEIHPERLPDLREEIHLLVPPARNTDILVRRNEGEVGKGDRRTIILALIKQKPQLAVKDITKSIPGVSEKTIQRELLAMVAEGILVKKGERRWSTYSLKQL